MKQLSGFNEKYRKVFWFVCRSNERSNYSDLLPQKVAEEGTWDPYLREILVGEIRKFGQQNT